MRDKLKLVLCGFTPLPLGLLLVKMTALLTSMEITPLIISRIEQNKRHVCDAELKMIAKALGVTMEWLCESDNDA